jgi:predicted DsbA family dithiol-disulfide isomerase
MTETPVPEVWEWAEYYCPFCYLAAVRFHAIRPEYEGRLRVRTRAFPLEVYGGGPAPRDILEQEWWLAAVQEPAADFAPYRGDDWPTTTLPAFEAAWCAGQQGDAVFNDFDLRVRRAFFAEGRNIGRREVLLEIAGETCLDLPRFTRDFASGEAAAAVLEEGKLGREQYRVRGTPTLMLADGTRLPHPIAYPRMQDRKIVDMPSLPCCGDECLDATRALLDRALSPG